MANQPIRGFEGTLTASGTEVQWVENWKCQLDVSEKDIGPFLDDGGQLYTYVSSKRLSGSIDCIIPKNRTAGQTVLLSGAINGTPIDLVLTTTYGYTISIPSGLLGNVKMEQNAGETIKASFDFKSNGYFTVSNI